MKTSRWIQGLAIVAALCATVAAFNYFVGNDVSARTSRSEVAQEPQGRHPFGEFHVTHPTSIARADLLACDEAGTVPAVDMKDLSADELGQLLHGTWARDLTWYGIPIQTESAMYFDYKGGQLTAFMYDQVSLGAGPMSARVQSIKSTLEGRAATPRLIYLACMKGVRDEYYKVSDGFLFEGLPAVDTSRANVLLGVWDQLNEEGFFDRWEFEMPGTMVNKPGSELMAPSLIGAYWQGNLIESQIDGNRAIEIRMDALYRGSHWERGVTVSGSEGGLLFREGSSVVAATEYGVGDAPAPETTAGYFKEVENLDGTTMVVPFERVVLEPGTPIQRMESVPLIYNN